MTESNSNFNEQNLQTPIKSAVLVPVYRRDDGKNIVVLVRRTEGNSHGGQIAFPGGKVSETDKTLSDTALREADEEIGLKSENVQIVKQLPNVYTNSSNFLITPFLSKIIKPERWVLSENEIAEILETEVNELLDPKHHGTETMNFLHWSSPKEVPFIWIGQHKLWGASYSILMPILESLI